MKKSEAIKTSELVKEISKTDKLSKNCVLLAYFLQLKQIYIDIQRNPKPILFN